MFTYAFYYFSPVIVLGKNKKHVFFMGNKSQNCLTTTDHNLVHARIVLLRICTYD